MAKSVLLVGLDPALLDFSGPEFAAFPGLDAAKLRAAFEADAAKFAALGYDAELRLVDFGETAVAVVEAALARKRRDCVLIGAGVRKIDRHFLLFERLVNVVHERAPDAKLCFNTGPQDSVDAVRRWI